jgi:hypothetical protein
MLQKVMLFSLLLTLCATTQAQTTFETADINEKEDLTNISISKTLLEEIFFSNPEKTIYYIDFEATKTQVAQLQLWKNQEDLVLNESTADLPYNTIYELNIETLDPGTYSIEVTTQDDDVFIQLFDVKDTKEELVERGEK